MSKVKSAFEKAMEKMESIGSLSAEEKQALKDAEQLKSLLANFYKGELSKDTLWQKARELAPALLREAQLSMVGSIRLGSTDEEFSLRQEGILALESVKQSGSVAGLEELLATMHQIRREYQEVKDGAIRELRQAVEHNPQMRMRQMKSPDGRAYPMTMTVDEAVQMRLAEFLPEHEKQYERLFVQTAERLKAGLR